jgi:ethanolamine ammonia-lyase large subunit
MSNNITYIKYGRRKNIGNYEYEEVSIEAIVRDDQTYEAIFDMIRNKVLDSLEFRMESTDTKLKAQMEIQKRLLPNIVPYNRKLKSHTDIVYVVKIQI